VIQVENVVKKYHTRKGSRVVLDHVNLRVERGQHVGVLGRNGAGKSTLVRLIGGAERPTSGTIRRRMKVSWPLAFGGAFQEFLSGLDNVRFICRIYDIDYRAALPFVEEFTELGLYMREPVQHYSSGMRARLAFALSLAVEFDCYLIDEVVVVGDGRFHEKCTRELFEKRRDRALIFVSHSMDEVAARCESAVVLHEAKLHAFDKIDEATAFYQKLTAA
jgi:capsular polysaccharide transport system ATP-binding protein